jgi:hypothetical protein
MRDGVLTKGSGPLRYNEPITFGRLGSAKDLSGSGIEFDEDGHGSWTTAPVAELEFSLGFAKQDLLLQLEANPFVIPEQIPQQKIFVFLNGLFVGYCAIRSRAVKQFNVNRGIISSRNTRLALVIPTAVSPQSLGLSEDIRELGLYITFIKFSVEHGGDKETDGPRGE